MVGRILEQEKAIWQVVGADCETCHRAPHGKTDVLESVRFAVKDLADFTDMLSGEDYVILSSLRAVFFTFLKIRC